MEGEQIEVVEEGAVGGGGKEEVVVAEVEVVTSQSEATTSGDVETGRVLEPLHPLRKVGRWQNYSGASYVESGGDHHYLEPAADNHVPPPVAENIVVTSDDMIGEMISVTDVVEEEVKTSHSPHAQLDHLEPNLPPDTLVKVEVLVETDGNSEDQKAAAYLSNRLVTADGMDPQWPEHPEPSPPLQHLSAATMPSTSTILIPTGHRIINSSSANTTTTFVYARPAVPVQDPHASPADRIDETVNEVVSSVMGRGGETTTTYVTRGSAGLPSFPSILGVSGGGGGGGEVLEELSQHPPPPLPSVHSRPHAGPVTIVKTRRPRSQLTDEDRRFRCTYCDKAFTARSSLDVHERIHTGERPYKCTECGKTFRHCGHLTCHLRTHTGERPYVCRVCGKGFTQSTPCRRHEHTQHNLSP